MSESESECMSAAASARKSSKSKIKPLTLDDHRCTFRLEIKIGKSTNRSKTELLKRKINN